MSVPTWEEFNNGKQFTTKGATEMAKLEYNKDEAENSSSNVATRVPGLWKFAITNAELITANSGNKGINVTMEVDQEGTLLKAFDTFWLSDKALFRLKDASVACGTTLPDEEVDMIGWTGKAQFSVNDKGYFEVDRYVSQDTEAKKEGSNFEGGAADAW